MVQLTPAGSVTEATSMDATDRLLASVGGVTRRVTPDALKKQMREVDAYDDLDALTASDVPTDAYLKVLDGGAILQGVASGETITTVGGAKLVVVRGPEFDNRTSTTLGEIAKYPDGTIGYVEGLEHEADSSATGTASAGNDLSVSGVAPSGAWVFWDIADLPPYLVPGQNIWLGAYIWEATASAATNYHRISSDGVKLRLAETIDGLFPVRALGAYADNTSHPLSGLYGTLAEAQAAFPRSHTEGLITSLSDEIDWACAQEAALIAKAERTEFSGVFLSPGIHEWNRGIVVTGNNTGFEFLGSHGFTQQQGSVRNGCQIDFTGTGGEPIMDLDGTFRSVRNVNFQTFGTARSAVRFGSPTNTYSGRSNLTSCSFIKGSGTSNYTVAAVEYIGPTDYSIIERCQFALDQSLFISFDQDGVGATTKLDIRDNVFQMVGTGDCRVIQFVDARIEQISSQNNAFIMEPGGGFLIGIDTDSIDLNDPTGYAQSISSVGDEWDYQSSSTASRFIVAKNIERVAVDRPVLQNQGGTPTAMISLENSHLTISNGNFRSINGPVVTCVDSVSTVTDYGGHFFDTGNTKGLVDTTLQGNIISLTQPAAGGTVFLRGADAMQRRGGGETFYQMEITSNALVRIAARSHTDTTRGFWVQGQTITIGFKNTSGGAWSSNQIDWNASINGNTSPGINNGETIWYRFVWMGNGFLQCADEVTVTSL